MTEEWIEEHLECLGEYVILVNNVDGQNGNITIAKDNLMSITEGTSNPPVYSELVTLPIAQQGWQTIFDSWKDKGIIS